METEKIFTHKWYGHDGIEGRYTETERWLYHNDNGRYISAPEDYVVENLYRDFCDENKSCLGLATDSRFEKDYIPSHKEDIIGYIRLLDEQSRRIAAQKNGRRGVLLK